MDVTLKKLLVKLLRNPRHLSAYIIRSDTSESRLSDKTSSRTDYRWDCNEKYIKCQKFTLQLMRILKTLTEI